MVLVLCTGANRALIRTRKFLLERSGYTVIAAMNEEEIAAACKQNGFDVVVLCQRISPQVKKKAATLIRKNCPSAKILELYEAPTGRQLTDADAWMEVPGAVPADLAAQVAALLPPEKKKTPA